MYLDGPTLISTERRKHVRVGMAIPALIATHDDVPTHPCTLIDASPGGGRVKLETDMPVPDDFVLLFTTTGNVRRICHVIWRRDNYLGVAFAGRFDHIT